MGLLEGALLHHICSVLIFNIYYEIIQYIEDVLCMHVIHGDMMEGTVVERVLCHVHSASSSLPASG